jgi:hypothetical protein
MSSSHHVSHADDILNSWKEIATYLNRGVRTVQRWEIDMGLPVRRPRGKGRSAVIAMRSELDAWTKACPIIHEEPKGQFISAPETRSLNSLILQSQELQKTTHRLRLDLVSTVNATVENIRRIANLTLPPPAPWREPTSETSSAASGSAA